MRNALNAAVLAVFMLPAQAVAQQADPWEPLGIRVGSFIYSPSLTTEIRGTSNATGTGSGSSGVAVTVTPELAARSDWSRHEVSFGLRGSYERFVDGAASDSPTASADIAARLDIADQWQADLSADYGYSTQEVSDPDFPSAATSRPGVHEFGGAAAVTGAAGRLRATLGAAVRRNYFEDANGGAIDQGDRNNTLASARLRVGYDSGAVFTPFAEAEIERRHYDRALDNGGRARARTTYGYRVGLAALRGPVITGEIALGGLHAEFDDPAFASLSTFTVDGSMVWSPTPLVSITGTVATALNPTTDTASSGSVAHSGSIEMAYAWRPNFSLTWSAGLSHERFEGTGRVDTEADVGVGFAWRINRKTELTAGYSHEWTDSTDPGSGSETDTVRLGLRVQH